MNKILEKIVEIQQHIHKEIQDDWIVKISQVCTLKGVDWKAFLSKIKKKTETCILKGAAWKNIISKIEKKTETCNLQEVDLEKNISEVEKKTETCNLQEVNSEKSISEVEKKLDEKVVPKFKVHNIGRFLYKIIETETLNENQVIPIRMYFPNEETLQVGENGQNQLPVIIYLHGNVGTEHQYDECDSICNALSKYTRHLVINVDYRCVPEDNFSMGLQDCYEVTRQICMDEFTYGINTHNITIMGEGIGGGLAAGVCHLAQDMQEFELTNQILICPVLASSDINLLRTLIMIAEEDPSCEEELEYAKKMVESGIKVKYQTLKNANQGYFNSGINRYNVRKTLKYIYKFLR